MITGRSLVRPDCGNLRRTIFEKAAKRTAGSSFYSVYMMCPPQFRRKRFWHSKNYDAVEIICNSVPKVFKEAKGLLRARPNSSSRFGDWDRGERLSPSRLEKSQTLRRALALKLPIAGHSSCCPCRRKGCSSYFLHHWASSDTAFMFAQRCRTIYATCMWGCY